MEEYGNESKIGGMLKRSLQRIQGPILLSIIR